MNPAEQFLDAWPHAAETNGWTKANLERMVKDATRMKISGDEFGMVVDALLRKPRRASVPAYYEVFNAMQAVVQARANELPDSTIQRLRESREAYRPWTDDERAWRKEVVACMKDDRPAPDLSEFLKARGQA